MNHEEVQDLFTFAKQLGTTPRDVLGRAARMCEATEVDATEQLQHLLQKGNRFCPIADDCANLLLTPIASYAKDNLGSALDLLWQDARQAAD